MKAQPGPWTADKFGNVTDADGERVLLSGFSLACGFVPETDPCYANSALAMAAPDMLEALENALFSASPTRLEHPTMFAAWEKMSAAIAKAKGEA